MRYLLISTRYHLAIIHIYKLKKDYFYMLKILLPLVLMILTMTGCGSAPKPQVQAPSVPLVKVAKSITLYEQELPVSKALASKAFAVQEREVSLKPNVLYTGLDSTKAFAFTIAPILKYSFGQEYVILSADIQKLISFTDDAMFEHTTHVNIQSLSLIYSNLSRQDLRLSKGQKTITNFKKIPTKSITFAIKTLFPDPSMNASSQYSLLAQDLNISFSLYNANFEDAIIREVLTTRNDAQKNELLIQTIAQENRDYYMQLLPNKSTYILPPHSIMYMPTDADLNYAIEKHELFFNTGKYKTTSGKYKILISEEMVKFDQSNVKVNSKHTIKTKQSKKKLKKATDIPDHDNFIDFSEGVE